MYLNVANYLGQRSEGTSGPVAPAEPAPHPPPWASRVDQPCKVREWAHEGHKRRRQKPKPKGDCTRWDKWDPTHTKEVIHVRKGIRYELKKALIAYDAITPATCGGRADAVCKNLCNKYRRLHYLDLENILIYQERGGDEQHVHMTPEQIQRNIELRWGEGVPMF